MLTGIGQHCGDFRRPGAAVFAEPSHVVQRADVAALKQQRAPSPICARKKFLSAVMRAAFQRLRASRPLGRYPYQGLIAGRLGTALVAR
jgi:hypothetical protein